jgi:hypothetical protein
MTDADPSITSPTCAEVDVTFGTYASGGINSGILCLLCRR